MHSTVAAINNLGHPSNAGMGGQAMPSSQTPLPMGGKAKGNTMLFYSVIFYITGADKAAEFATFINWLIVPGKGRILLSEEKNWTPEGELIRSMDYVAPATDTEFFGPEGVSTREVVAPVKVDTKEEDAKNETERKRKEAEKEREDVAREEEKRFTADDYVSDN